MEGGGVFMGGAGSGGHNREKDCVEDYPRIDSYNIDKPRKNVHTVAIPCNYGGNRLYYVCPRCKGLHRFLYPVNRHYLCRDCAELNYWTQQNRDAALIEHHIYRLHDLLKCYDDLTAKELAEYIPDKPPGMHWKTYNRLVDKLETAQEEYRSWLLLGEIRHLNAAAGMLLLAIKKGRNT